MTNKYLEKIAEWDKEAGILKNIGLKKNKIAVLRAQGYTVDGARILADGGSITKAPKYFASRDRNKKIMHSVESRKKKTKVMPS